MEEASGAQPTAARPSRAPALLWVIPIAFVLVLDAASALFVASLLADPSDSGQEGAVLVATMLLALVAFLLSLANLIQFVALSALDRPWLADYARKAALAVKLGLAPFFLGGGILMVLLMFIALHPVLAVVGWLPLLTFGVVGWLIMLPGSLWGVAAAIALCRSGRIGGLECAVHVMLQLVFVADVVDAVVLFARGRRRS